MVDSKQTFFSQGDVLKVEGCPFPLLVVSKNFFHTTGQAMLAPILENTFLDPLHIPVNINSREAKVCCEQVRLFDLDVRGYSKLDSISVAQLMDITDAIQSIFDY